MSLKEFISEQRELHEAELKIQSLIFMVENLDIINESEISEEEIYEGLNDKLGKIGLKIHKSKGILDYIKSFTSGIGKLFLLIIKGEEKKAMELVKSMKKEDFMDFLFKLDMGTLHLFTGPIHMIDAWTGWDLAANLKSHIDKGDGIVNVIKQAIEKVKSGVKELFQNDAKRQKELLSYIDNIDKEII